MLINIQLLLTKSGICLTLIKEVQIVPDGDRFERSLRGGGWRSAYRIAAGGGTVLRVTEKLVGACLSLIDSEHSECAHKAMGALTSALEPRTMPLFQGSVEENSFERLTQDMDDISGDYRFGEFSQHCSRAVSRCFIAQEHSARLPLADIERLFARELITDIVSRNFFPAVRESIALNAGRDLVAQLAWEHTILDNLGGLVEGFARSLMSGRRMRVVRSRPVEGNGKPFNLQRLNEPLRVLGV
jgi:hypothetical protein